MNDLLETLTSNALNRMGSAFRDSALLSDLLGANSRLSGRARSALKLLGISIRLSDELGLQAGDQSALDLSTENLEVTLLRLGSFDELVRALEEGVNAGVLSMNSGRFFVMDQGTSLSHRAPKDVTSILKRVSSALKANESAALLQLTQQAKEDGSNEMPRVVRLNADAGQGGSVLHGPDSPPANTMELVSQFLRTHQELDDGTLHLANSLFKVMGDEVILPEGAFLPVELVSRSQARGSASDSDTQPKRLLVPLSRVSEVNLAPLVSEGRRSATSSMPSAEQIELAWSLVRGLREGGSEAKQLEGSLRMKLESELGMDLGHVRLHTGAAAEFVTATLGAEALASERDVIIPEKNLLSNGGAPSETLVHELVHVKQHAENKLTAPREELEAEASIIASMGVVNTENLSFAKKTQPEVIRSPDRESSGAFMEWSDYHDKNGESPFERRWQEAFKAPSRSPRLMSEKILQRLTESFHWERRREKEEHKDRVF